MGYNIYIGEAYIFYDAENGYCAIDVKIHKNVNAPNFGHGDISSITNARYPSYTGMSNFLRKVSLSEMFFDEENGIMREHPGCFPITNLHLNKIKEAKTIWENNNLGCQNKIPDAKNEPKDFNKWDYDKQEIYTDKFDWDYARLIWYEFWFEWALNNCINPVIYNS